MRRSKTKWDEDMREMLSSLLKVGYKISAISNLMDIPKTAIYREIKRGTTDEEYAMHQYIAYKPEIVLEKRLKELKGVQDV